MLLTMETACLQLPSLLTVPEARHMIKMIALELPLLFKLI